MATHNEILEYIEFLRDCIPNAKEVFLNGHCVQFAMLLDTHFPGGTILYQDGHACFEYKETCYDVTGNIEKPKNAIPITEYGPWMMYQLMKSSASIASGC
jgi:hypothetical protein